MHGLLLLHPRRNAGADDVRSLVLSFQTTYYLNSHNFIEKELGCEKAGFRKSDKAFLAVSDQEALQAPAGHSKQVLARRASGKTVHGV